MDLDDRISEALTRVSEFECFRLTQNLRDKFVSINFEQLFIEI